MTGRDILVYRPREVWWKMREEMLQGDRRIKLQSPKYQEHFQDISLYADGSLTTLSQGR